MQILLIMTTILMHGAEVVRSDEQDVLPTLKALFGLAVITT